MVGRVVLMNGTEHLEVGDAKACGWIGAGHLPSYIPKLQSDAVACGTFSMSAPRFRESRRHWDIWMLTNREPRMEDLASDTRTSKSYEADDSIYNESLSLTCLKKVGAHKSPLA